MQDFSISNEFPAQNPEILNLEFRGSGSEYFRIWIVNILLTILTAGIYSAWAKVRKNNYFYSCTYLAGSSFEYHGNPIAILKGRVVAFLLLLGYNLAFHHSVGIGFLVVLLLAAIAPFLVWKSLQFKLYNSSFRGIRFGFRGDAKSAYLVYLLWPLLSLLTLYTLVPFSHYRIKQFQHNESRFGNSYFSFSGNAGQFYKAYLLCLGVFIGGVVALTMAFGTAVLAAILSLGKSTEVGAGLGFVSIVLYFISLYVWIFAIYPIFMSMIQNLIWNETQLGKHQFRSNLHWLNMAGIMLSNIVLIALTLGLFTPFAQIRLLRYRIESMQMLVNGNLDEFINDSQAQIDATGEGVADLLDFDLSL